MLDLANIRKDYQLQELTEKETLESPFDQFSKWMEEAIQAQVLEPTAMVLSTIKFGKYPSSRVVLLKGIESGGFCFYTNYSSDKGNQLSDHPFAALNFFWPELERQIRIEGEVKRLEPSISDAYFKSRPLGSQIGAHASPQSKPIKNRTELEEKVKSLETLYQNQPIPRPENWGGFVIIPTYFEFWQGRSSRLHDRIVYEKVEDHWSKKRLAP